MKRKSDKLNCCNLCAWVWRSAEKNVIEKKHIQLNCWMRCLQTAVINCLSCSTRLLRRTLRRSRKSGRCRWCCWFSARSVCHWLMLMMMFGLLFSPCFWVVFFSNFLYVFCTDFIFSSCSFRAAAPAIWSLLPDSLRSSDLFNSFQWDLKTTLFQQLFIFLSGKLQCLRFIYVTKGTL